MSAMIANPSKIARSTRSAARPAPPYVSGNERDLRRPSSPTNKSTGESGRIKSGADDLKPRQHLEIKFPCYEGTLVSCLMTYILWK